ncbi:tautomerase family protein [Ancylobacter sp.]|uniref:tautomerase family protein n=1 Tax=Ancylobacter sp. TaxID=1872567 RepID=UPI003BA9C2B8
MPMIQIKYATAAPAAGLDAALAARASQLAQQRLGKDPALTAVLVQRADPEQWFCAGRSLADAGLSGFWLDIRVTEGTNTKDEKAAFIAEIFAAFGDMLGPLHAESYVHVVEARGDAYGYAGLTQEQRYIAARP